MIGLLLLLFLVLILLLVLGTVEVLTTNSKIPATASMISKAEATLTTETVKNLVDAIIVIKENRTNFANLVRNVVLNILLAAA